MEKNIVQTKELTPAPIITSEALLKHWQGHRGLTRRVIEAFPEKNCFNIRWEECVLFQTWHWK